MLVLPGRRLVRPAADDDFIIGTITFENFATTQAVVNKDHFYLLQNNTNKYYDAKYL